MGLSSRFILLRETTAVRIWSWDSTTGCHVDGTTVPLWNFSDQINSEAQLIILDYFHEKRIQCGLVRAMLDARGDAPLAGKERAQRFELQTPLRYRVNGASKWRRGVTKRIGCSGVLFRGGDLAELGSPVEISLIA
jgi:hypothetical protein